MKIEELKEKGAIYFEHIQEGFECYPHRIEKMSQEEAEENLLKRWNQNGEEHSFVDFYYFQLEEEAKQKVEATLSVGEVQYLKSYSNPGEDIIFPLNKDLLTILTKLNETETLFSTFYFTKEPCTLWGNYNQEYVIFQKP